MNTTKEKPPRLKVGALVDNGKPRLGVIMVMGKIVNERCDIYIRFGDFYPREHYRYHALRVACCGHPIWLDGHQPVTL